MSTLATITHVCTGILPQLKVPCHKNRTIGTLCSKCHTRMERERVTAEARAVKRQEKATMVAETARKRAEAREASEAIKAVKRQEKDAADAEAREKMSFPYKFKNSKPNPFTHERMALQLTFLKNTADNTDMLNATCDLKLRQSNIPEWFTENLMIHIINNYGGIGRVKWCRLVGLGGDMCCEMYERVEGKSFASPGPSSFGPDKKFDIIFFLDMKEWREDKWVLWQVNLNHTSSEWKGIKMNKTESFDDQTEQGKRPHIAWDRMHPQIHDHCVKIYDGSFDGIFKKV